VENHVLGYGKRLTESLSITSRPTSQEVLSRRLHELRVGLELEYLVVDGKSEPIQKSAFDKIIEKLSEAFPNSRIKRDEAIQILVCNMGRGVTLEVKPDFAFNVVELSLGVLTYGLFRELTPVVLERFFETLGTLGLRIEKRSVVNSRRDQIEIVPLPRLAGYLEQFEEDRKSLVGKPWYPAEIASIQVHVESLTQDFFDLAPYFFIQEFIFNKKYNFGTSFEFSNPSGVGRFGYYEKSLGEKYLLKTIPEKIYDGIAQYEEYADASIPYFKEDPISPVRDLTFVRPRSFGTIEFRSACTNSDFRVIDELVLQRIAQVITGMGVLEKSEEQRKAFIEQSRKLWIDEGESKQSRLSKDISDINEKVFSKVREELTKSRSEHSLGAVAA
jgi:hypothetical protein